MSCNCKNSGEIDVNNEPKEKLSLPHNIIKYVLKVFGFIIGVCLTPIILITIIWFMFDIIVLNKGVNLSFLFKKLVKINKAIMEEDELDEDNSYDDFEEINDYITENVEEIKNVE